MKITELITSKSVAEYLEKQNYEFSALQQAYIIAKSKLSVNEKHAEWKRLYSTMNDCEIFNGSGCEYIPSLFDRLRKIIVLQKKYIEKFFQEEEAIYCLTGATRDGENIFVGSKCRHTWQESTYDDEITNRQGVLFEINKGVLNEKVEITATVNELGEVFDLKVFGAPAADDNILTLFDYINLNFPVPFKVGDAVFETGNADRVLFVKGFSDCGENVVCCSIPSFDGVDEDYWVRDVLSLEYYRKPLTDEEQRLKKILEKTHERKNGLSAK